MFAIPGFKSRFRPRRGFREFGGVRPALSNSAAATPPPQPGTGVAASCRGFGAGRTRRVW